MLSIDGSLGEGGGQIVRTAISLSAVTGIDVELSNMRSNRPFPGLAAQHLAAVKAVALMCDATVEGAQTGSQKLVFRPGRIKGGNHVLDVGTAGSITLVLAACLPAALFAGGAASIEVTGGSDVRWSPPYDYFEKVFLRHLSGFGIEAHCELERRGYYPKGGGVAVLRTGPWTKPVAPNLARQGVFHYGGKINCSPEIPKHVPQLIRESALERLSQRLGVAAEIGVESCESASPGVGITIFASSENTVLGASCLGEKGIPSKKVAYAAVDDLVREVESGATADVHAADQLIPYMALAAQKTGEPSSFISRELTMHAQTNMAVVERFLDVGFRIEKLRGNGCRVTCFKA
ncbi:MAG: RNA 3'-phosphate cyclase [Thermoplasmata archaeon HGW-Thermoplasmata-1]|nr:MAG: RNA 3'-phosphate cyclase [Thermoplasmata archaeon HGW-Thermoplasmata-1]